MLLMMTTKATDNNDDNYSDDCSQCLLHLFLIMHYGNMIQICSGITSDRVLNGVLYAQRLQKLIYLYLLTGCFMKISLQLSEQIFNRHSKILL